MFIEHEFWVVYSEFVLKPGSASSTIPLVGDRIPWDSSVDRHVICIGV